uniref:Putative secreted protein n=1 Tax=Ixodes ricinus TaxID=34613 RepID=A0A147BRR6_IXORI
MYSLEAFHSVLIGTLLAVLHFNANAEYLQSTIKDSQGRPKVKASTSRNGHLAAFRMGEGTNFEIDSTGAVVQREGAFSSMI